MKYIRCGSTGSIIAALLATLCAPLRADFTYTETTQITGGSMLSLMKMAGTFSKQARAAGDPVVSTIAIKGNRMTRIGKDRTEIVDLDKGTVTEIDNLKREYTVMTFDQMKQQMDAAMAKARQQQTASPAQQSPNADVKFQVNVRNTGVSKDVAGVNANESILTMMMNATDKASGQTGSLGITTDMWLAPEVAGYQEVRDFYQRYALRMGNVFSDSGGIGGMLAAHPGAAEGMTDMAKEISKMKGIPVLEIMRMGNTVNGAPLPAASEAPLPPQSAAPVMLSAGEVAQQTATSALASRLGALGGFGGFGKKKQQEAAPKAETPQPEADGTAVASVLVESQTQLGSFSQAPVDSSRFDVPAGFREVQPKTAQ